MSRFETYRTMEANSANVHPPTVSRRSLLCLLTEHLLSLSPFQFEVLTTGWVSLALTFRGDLRGADIIVGWVDDGKATIVVSA